MRKYPTDADRARLVSVFTNLNHFVRSDGLNGADQIYAMVINRECNVLARAEDALVAGNAQSLRVTLL